MLTPSSVTFAIRYKHRLAVMVRYSQLMKTENQPADYRRALYTRHDVLSPASASVGLRLMNGDRNGRFMAWPQTELVNHLVAATVAF